MTERSTILIVDDDPLNVDILEQELELLGHDTLSAGNGQEALAKVAAEPPDLILLDVMMPIMDGFTVCQILKENTETRLIPIIIMTALDAVEDRIKGIEAGADDFLTKPVNDQELQARIQTSLKLKRTLDQKMGELRQVSDQFAKFVPETVKRIISTDPEAPELAKHEQDISALFVDISGYTRLSERLPQDVLNPLVEQYFSAFFDRIYEAGGDINQTAGDSLMATFQDPDPQRHAILAVDTALALLDTTQALNKENNVQTLAIHMGLNAGVAWLGSTRYEGRHGTRWMFTANGPVINLAARLVDVAEAGQILAGPETVQRVGNRYRLRWGGLKRLKNIAEPVETHFVLGPSLPS